MRFELVKWSYDVHIKKSATKFVLTFMASHADALDCFDRSLKYVVNKTSLNPKTVSSSVTDLISMGFIADTGKRGGRTGKTKIYQLIVTKTHLDGELNSTNNGTVNGADTPIKLSTNTPENGVIKYLQKRGSLGSNSPENGVIKYPQKRYSVLLKELYIKNKPQLNLKAWELWITHLSERYPDELLTINAEHVADVQIKFGDHHQQLRTVKFSIQKKWKHLHPISTLKSVNGAKAIDMIRRSSGLSCKNN